jgi:hypothetical protein
MNTNTVDQAEILKLLGVKYKSTIHYTFDPLMPNLTLDDLHRVLEAFGAKTWPEPNYFNTNDGKGKPCWIIRFNLPLVGYEDFPRTKNHAEDWTDILIWLLGEGHITAEQINTALEVKL